MVIGRRKFLRDCSAAVVGAGAAFMIGKTRGQETTKPSMLMRLIPSSKQKVPAIGMGTWQTFDPPRLDDASLAPLREVLKAFFDGGGRVVDSSPMYGKAEDVTGRLSSELKVNGELFLATKVWTEGEAAGVRQMEESLRRLRRERLDLIQVHNLLDWRTHLATLRKWKEQRRVRYIGVTHYVPSAFDALEKIVREEKVDFVQLPYSLGLREAEKRLLPAARDAGVAVLVNRPFEGGTLFASVRGKPVPEWVKPFADTWAQAFLKFLLANEAVTCVIPATSKPEHMRDNLAAAYGRLPTPDECSKLSSLT
jgi:diketogulonate reductase-like aldo/keto reductase